MLCRTRHPATCQTTKSASQRQCHRCRHPAGIDKVVTPPSPAQLQSESTSFDWEVYLQAALEHRCIKAFIQAMLLNHQLDQLHIRHQRALRRNQDSVACHLEDQMRTTTSIMTIYVDIASKLAEANGWTSLSSA